MLREFLRHAIERKLQDLNRLSPSSCNTHKGLLVCSPFSIRSTFFYLKNPTTLVFALAWPSGVQQKIPLRHSCHRDSRKNMHPRGRSIAHSFFVLFRHRGLPIRSARPISKTSFMFVSIWPDTVISGHHDVFLGVIELPRSLASFLFFVVLIAVAGSSMSSRKLDWIAVRNHSACCCSTMIESSALSMLLRALREVS